MGKFLIVGLGNPGRKYRGNRHNIGFMIVAKPQTFMYSSGDSVGPLANYYRIPNGNGLVIYDELDLPFGTIRLREKGGAGGHNGMKSIINHLGDDFPRVRLGIGRPPGQMPVPAYVLRDFDKGEQPVVADILHTAVSAVETYLKEGIQLAMSRHNGTILDKN